MTGPALQPMAFTGSFELAADQSLPQDGIPFTFAGQYAALQYSGLNPTGAGTVSVPFGSLISPGAVGLLVRYDAPNQADAAPVYLTINGGSEPLELTPGSFFVYFNANPVLGITTASFAFTSACSLRVWVLG
jgi:hypothetical protein